MHVVCGLSKVLSLADVVKHFFRLCMDSTHACRHVENGIARESGQVCWQIRGEYLAGNIVSRHADIEPTNSPDEMRDCLGVAWRRALVHYWRGSDRGSGE